MIVEGQVGNRSLDTGVLRLTLLEALYLVDLQVSVLVTPPEQDLLGIPVWRLVAATAPRAIHLDLPELVDGLLASMFLHLSPRETLQIQVALVRWILRSDQLVK